MTNNLFSEFNQNFEDGDRDKTVIAMNDIRQLVVHAVLKNEPATLKEVRDGLDIILKPNERWLRNISCGNSPLDLKLIVGEINGMRHLLQWIEEDLRPTKDCALAAYDKATVSLLKFLYDHVSARVRYILDISEYFEKQGEEALRNAIEYLSQNNFVETYPAESGDFSLLELKLTLKGALVVHQWACANGRYDKWMDNVPTISKKEEVNHGSI